MELMIGTAVLVIALLAMLLVFTSCMGLNDTSGNLTAAMTVAQQKLEELRNLRDSGMPLAAGHYSETLDNWSSFDHRVAIDIFDDGSDPDGRSNADLYWISISVSWRQKGGRIIGEDNGAGAGVALNGICDGTEDVNTNTFLDSPARIITLMKN
jgi:hypothetical protein